jgi:hypothetical protein
VENLVGWVKGSFFKQRRFLDREDLAAQLLQWLQEVNTQRPSRATGEIPLARMGEERKRLRPLKIPASELAQRIPVQVGPTADVHAITNPCKAFLVALVPKASGRYRIIKAMSLPRPMVAVNLPPKGWFRIQVAYPIRYLAATRS